MHSPRRVVSVASSLALALTISGCGGGAVNEPATATPGPQSTPAVPSAAGPADGAAMAAVAAPDRSVDDRALDAGRKPAELLSFCGIRPGMRVAEIAAGTGYTTELLARAVGPTGSVYAVNSHFILEKFAEKPWTERLAKPVMKNVARVDREFDDPLPEGAKNLDAVLDVLFYHDTFWLKVDREKMNAAIFKALKPGGVYCVIDHSGRAGTGATEVQTLHRIEEKIVRDEIQKAGFKIGTEGTFLKNPSDARDWNASPRAAGEKRGTSDRFAIAFVRPAS